MVDEEGALIGAESAKGYEGKRSLVASEGRLPRSAICQSCDH